MTLEVDLRTSNWMDSCLKVQRSNQLSYPGGIRTQDLQKRVGTDLVWGKDCFDIIETC